MILAKNLLRLKNSEGYISTGILVIILLIVFLSFIVIPKISVFKAKGQQSEARIKLLEVYNAMYAYKLENGSFIHTKNKVISILNLPELDAYLRDETLHFNNKNDKIVIISNQDQFAIAYFRVLANGFFDIQRINSKKVTCYMLNGIDTNIENCNHLQVFDRFSKYDEIIEIKKLNIFIDD